MPSFSMLQVWNLGPLAPSANFFLKQDGFCTAALPLDVEISPFYPRTTHRHRDRSFQVFPPLQ